MQFVSSTKTSVEIKRVTALFFNYSVVLAIEVACGWMRLSVPFSTTMTIMAVILLVIFWDDIDSDNNIRSKKDFSMTTTDNRFLKKILSSYVTELVRIFFASWA